MDQPAADLVGDRSARRRAGRPIPTAPGPWPCRRRRASPRSGCVRSSSSRRTPNTRASLSIVVRRRASVGCAVITSCSSAASSTSCSCPCGRPGSAQAVDHLAQRSVPRSLRVGGVTRAQAPHPLVVLGQVDELEPAGERAHQHLGLVEAERGHQLRQLVGRPLVAQPRPLSQRHRIVQQRAAHRDLRRARSPPAGHRSGAPRRPRSPGGRNGQRFTHRMITKRRGPPVRRRPSALVHSNCSSSTASNPTANSSSR